MTMVNLLLIASASAAAAICLATASVSVFFSASWAELDPAISATASKRLSIPPCAILIVSSE